MLEKFLQTINTHDLFHRQDHLFIAASGGLDSTVLCELCHRAGFHFTLLHCNFQLRGQESERDQEFVSTLAKKYQCELLFQRFETEQYAATHHLSIQEAARALRYNWFHELLAEREAFILTAHHRDDSIETLLMNFFRGTGLRGLTGIPAKNEKIRRPLLFFTREELESFAKENKLEWVEDSSNLHSYYTRNYFRNELLPALEKVFPRVKQNLSANLDRFNDIDKLYRLATHEIRKKLVRRKGDEFHIPVKQLMQFRSRALVFEIMSAFGFHEKQLDEVISLAGSDHGKFIMSPGGNYRIIRHRHWFIISPARSVNAAHFIIEKNQEKLAFGLGSLEFTEQDAGNIPAGRDIAMLDHSLLEFPLLLREWKTGDYFYPLGMKKKKKISRFFIDLKLSRSEKEKAWVLEDAGERIIWVVGRRIDERFKITGKTSRVLRVSFRPGE